MIKQILLYLLLVFTISIKANTQDFLKYKNPTIILIIESTNKRMLDSNIKGENDPRMFYKFIDTNKNYRMTLIRNQYKEINNCKNCIDKEYTESCARISIRLDKNRIIKIAVEINVAGDVTITQEYYLNNGDLLFVYEVYLDWGGIKTENRYYFENNKMFKKITPPSKSIYSSISDEKQLIKILNDLIERYKNGENFKKFATDCP